MSLLDPFKEGLSMVQGLSPARLKALADERLDDLLEGEALRARRRVDELTRTFPSAQRPELSHRLVDQKKQLASMVGGVTGVFGLGAVPVDLVGMAYLQLSLLADLSCLYKADLRSPAGKQELLDLFSWANGLGPLERSSPRVLGSLASLLLRKGGFTMLGRAVPLIAAPVSAYLNHQHIQKVGEAAVRHYDGWARAQEKARRRGGG